MLFAGTREIGSDGMDVKMKALTKLKDELATKYGADSVMFTNEIPVRPVVSSGSLALDFATGIGGFPSDRVIEVAGQEGSGKSSLGLITMANFLDAQPDRGAIILDTEHKLTASWVEQLVGKERMERVILLWPDSMEQATDMYVKAVSSGEISFVMLDSIGGSPSQRVMTKSAEIGNIGGNALAVTRFAQLASIYSQKYHCLCYGVNQTREDLAGYHRMITPGGRAWKHACVLRIQLKRGQGKIEKKIDGEDIPIGYEVIAKIAKNQLAPPGRTAFYWFFNVNTDGEHPFGIDQLDEIIRLGITTKVIKQGGAWYNHMALSEGKIQGREALIALVREDKALQQTLVSEIKAVLAEGGEVANLVAPMTNPEEDLADEVSFNTANIHMGGAGEEPIVAEA